MNDDLEFKADVEKLRDLIMGGLQDFDDKWQMPLVVTITPSSYVVRGGKTRTVYPVVITRPLDNVW